MSNPTHFNIYQKGPETWNEWRRKNPHIRPDLSDFKFANVKSNLRRYSKPGINRSTWGGLMQYRLMDFDFSNTNLAGCHFWECILHNTSFAGADLSGAEFRQCDLREVSLEDADLSSATFVLTSFYRTQFRDARFGHAHFAYSPLSQCEGLEETQHPQPSHMDFLSLVHSDTAPFEFARHFGFSPEWYGIVRKLDPARYFDCFISYSTQNEVFVQTLRAALLLFKVPCWYAPYDYRLNAEWHPKALEDYELSRDLYNMVDACDVVILVVSNNSLRSAWVHHEIRRVQKQRVIPLLIEDVDPALAAQARWLEVFGWLDFRNWRAEGALRTGLAQLLAGVLRPQEQ